MKIGGFEITKLKKMVLFTDDSVQITLEGREACDKERFADTRGRVLDNLSTAGVNTIREIALETRISVDGVKAAIASLAKKGLVRKVGGVDNDTDDYSQPKSHTTPPMGERKLRIGDYDIT